jgi:hypothetical protein
MAYVPRGRLIVGPRVRGPAKLGLVGQNFL